MKATSLTNVVALGARFGDTLVVTASGPQADDVLLALARAGGRGVRRRLGGRRARTRFRSAWLRQPARHEQARRSSVAPPAAGDVLTGVPASAGLAFGPAHHLHGAIAPATGPHR